MVDVFSQSRVNLNISNSRHWDLRYVLSSYRALRTTLRSPKDREQIKARHFEIAGCGGFQLTYYCEDLERHFVIGDEVAVYLDPDDLVDKVRFYLAHDEERERIAAAGYERARRDHTAGRRLTDLLAAVTSGARTPRGC
jgi:spore maturation protein CgeB